METPYHVVFAVAVTLLAIYLFVPIPIDWTVMLLAALSGAIADFDHLRKIWKLANALIFFGLLALFVIFFDRMMPGEYVAIYFGALLVSGMLTWLLYKTAPLRTKTLPSPGSGAPFLVLYTLIICHNLFSRILAGGLHRLRLALGFGLPLLANAVRQKVLARQQKLGQAVRVAFTADQKETRSRRV
ncbi:hypothetical protein HZC09_02720 [Candidatus Micrarchaeota archaeon]|nr:hypothetical protein [Candidatus Micrarchaeota archaeon]